MQPVIHSLTYALMYLHEQLEEVELADLVMQPGGMVNHPAWTIGHLTFICQMLGEVIGVAPWLPEDFAAKFGTGSVPVADANAYESKKDALARLEDARQRIVAAVEKLSEERLTEPFPDPSYHDVFPTIRHFLTQVLVGHTSFHVGQISVWRRAVGLSAMKRAFE